MHIDQAKQIIQSRYSCRTYTGTALSADDYYKLSTHITHTPSPPFGTQLRFHLIANQQDDSTILKGLGTYGMLRGVPAYLAGIVEPGPNAMEDFGYVMEYLVLKASAMGLGSCWLGGTFTKSAFARRSNLQGEEILAALIAMGYPSDKRLLRDRVTRRVANSDRRSPWESLFFEDNFNAPLSTSLPNHYIDALHAVRRGPSASNKQPWRIVKVGDIYHFYVCRTSSYTRILKTSGLVDLQRNDVGIAMCHFELALREEKITGEWFHAETYPESHNALTSYIVSWRETS